MRSTLHAIVLALALLGSGPVSADSGVCEARALDRARALWPGLASGIEAEPDAAAAGADQGSGELPWMETLDDPTGEVRLAALRTAAVFRRWAAKTLLRGVAFADGDAPAPEAWAHAARSRLAREEAAALVAALEDADDGQRAADAPAIARLRYRRLATLGAGEVAALERGELRDGLALYTAMMSLGDEAAPWRAALVTRLRRVAEGAEPASPAESGAAIALVLDRTKPAWRDDLVRAPSALQAHLAPLVRPWGSAPAPGS